MGPTKTDASRCLTPTAYLAEALPHFSIDTALLRLRLERGQGAQATLRRAPGRVEFLLPRHFDFSHAPHQAWLSQVLVRELRRQAQGCLPPRLDALARAYDLRYGRVTIKNVVSRWGSCSALGNINLSLWLMAAPEPLVDYVIKHELAHLNEMNHGPRFWAEVDRMTGGCGRRLEAQMRAFSRSHALLFRIMALTTRGRLPA